MENYRFERLLQKGKEGTEVWLAIHLTSNEQVAIKKVNLYASSREKRFKIKEMLAREIMIHKILYASVEEACKIQDVIWHKNHCYLVLEYIEGEDFWEYLRGYSENVKRWGEDSIGDRLFFFKKMVEIIWKLTMYGVIHHDTKLDNFMICRKERRIFIIDFDRSTCSSQALFSQAFDQATYEMQPPEQYEAKTFHGGTVSSSCSWVLGILLFILVSFSNEWPFELDPKLDFDCENPKNNLDYHARIRMMILANQRKEVRIWNRLYQNGLLDFRDQCLHAAMLNHLIANLLEPNPLKRWQFNEILSHPALHLELFDIREFRDYLPLHKQEIQETTKVSRLYLPPPLSDRLGESPSPFQEEKDLHNRVSSCCFQAQEYEFVFEVTNSKERWLTDHYLEQLVQRWKYQTPKFIVSIFPSQHLSLEDVCLKTASDLVILFENVGPHHLAQNISHDSTEGGYLFQIYCWILFGEKLRRDRMELKKRKHQNSVTIEEKKAAAPEQEACVYRTALNHLSVQMEAIPESEPLGPVEHPISSNKEQKLETKRQKEVQLRAKHDPGPFWKWRRKTIVSSSSKSIQKWSQDNIQGHRKKQKFQPSHQEERIKERKRPQSHRISAELAPHDTYWR